MKHRIHVVKKDDTSTTTTDGRTAYECGGGRGKKKIIEYITRYEAKLVITPKSLLTVNESKNRNSTTYKYRTVTLFEIDLIMPGKTAEREVSCTGTPRVKVAHSATDGGIHSRNTHNDRPANTVKGISDPHYVSEYPTISVNVSHFDDENEVKERYKN